MKKLLSIFVFVLIASMAAQAQSGIGIRGGANFSNLEGDLRNESRFENKIGFHGGITFGVGIVDNFFFIQPELLYSTKGFKYENSEISLPTGTIQREGSMNYNYLDLPVLAKIKAGPIYFEAGPQASYLLSVNNKINESLNGERYSSTTTERDVDGLRRFEVGYAAGVGFATNSGISLGIRYNGSLSDFVNENPEEYFEGDLTNARHSTIMATVGFTFGR
ncbi:porin family protein [Pontibacter pamirensis]|uniref:porin family protein n=1 Tax=Pontibacter pamirensis TaxID=2562824 RepID=UPI001F3A6D6F|nr:porin family protein [Pontibacter pamirensis]